jgi:hypothetical protein
VEDRTAREEVLEATADLAAAIDERRWDDIAATFLPDAEGYGANGRDAIVATMRAHLDGCGPTQHLLGNHRVDVKGDRARSRAAARVRHEGAGPMAGERLEVMGDYDDEWVRADGRWMLARRTFDMRIVDGPFGVLRPVDVP